VLSGHEIPVTGIWEPWYILPPSEEGLLSGLLDRISGKPPRLTGKVGCPNYFLAGTTAFEYETDGAGDKVAVAWRLLWEDTRYLDGTIPEEEAGYSLTPRPATHAPVPQSRPVVLTAYPGEPCPEAGEWHSVNWEDRRAVLKKGDPMPGPQYSKTGVVIWHLKKDAP